MEQQKKFYKQIIHSRQQAILEMIKRGKDIPKIEREMALLVLDTVNVLPTESLSLKEGCKCFIQIDYAINQELENKFSEEFRDLLNEAMLLDEIGTNHGPDLNRIVELAKKILNRPNRLSGSKITALSRV